MGRILCGEGNHGRKDAAIRANAEKFQPARIAAIGSKTQAAWQEIPNAARDAIRRNALQIEISAPRAVSVSRKRNRNAPGVKPKIAGVAPPGPEPGEASQKIQNSGSARPEAVGTAALGTNHDQTPPSLAAA
jgi:hypothetical protein